MNKYKLIYCFLLFVMISSLLIDDIPAASKKKISKKRSKIKKKKVVKSKLSTTLSLEHYGEFKETSNPETGFVATFLCKVNKLHNLMLIQQATKIYKITPGRDEVSLSDTLLYHYYSIYKKKNMFNLNFRTGLTLPMGKQSRRDRVYTKLSFRPDISKSFFSKKLKLKYAPYFNYYFNKYTSVRGRALSNRSYGQIFTVIINPVKKLSFVSILSHGVVKKEKGEYAPLEPKYTNGNYSVGIYGAYGLSNNISGRLGYSYGNMQFKDGNRQYFFYDENSSIYYVGIDISI